MLSSSAIQTAGIVAAGLTATFFAFGAGMHYYNKSLEYEIINVSLDLLLISTYIL